MVAKLKGSFKLDLHCSRITVGLFPYKRGHQRHRVMFYRQGSVECLQHKNAKERRTFQEDMALQAIAGETIEGVTVPACLYVAELWKTLLHESHPHTFEDGWITLATGLSMLLPKLANTDRIKAIMLGLPSGAGPAIQDLFAYHMLIKTERGLQCRADEISNSRMQLRLQRGLSRIILWGDYQ
jgi:hypothetical protein